MGFKNVLRSVASDPNVRDPAALAAAIGRKKYGNRAMAHAATAGTPLAHEERGLEGTPLGRVKRLPMSGAASS